MKIEKNCIVGNVPESVYHADPCPELSLSSSMAVDLMEKTEIEAWYNCQRLNPNYEPKTTEAADVGTVAHEYVLQGSMKSIEITPYPAFQSKEAKAAKDDILSRGKIPLAREKGEALVKNVKEMKKRFHQQIAEHKDFAGAMIDGQPEMSAFAFDGEIYNRARFDWIDAMPPFEFFGKLYDVLLVDYKTTGLSFDQWEKNVLWGDSGKYMQKHHYERTYKLIYPDKKPLLAFFVQQTFEPFLLKIFVIDDSYMSEVEGRYQMARRRFMHCKESGVWRGVHPVTYHSYPPPWILNKWQAQEVYAIEDTPEQEKNVQPEETLRAG